MAEGVCIVGLKIIGTGRMLPLKGIANTQLAAMVDTSDEWITTRTGIKNRYVCTTESLTDLAEGAARKALDNAGLSAAEIDMIICPTLAGDYAMPSLACCVAQRLGVACNAFDINAACSGFVYGLEVAQHFLASGKYRNILIVSADMMSRLIDWSDRSTCVLFGDGAAACVVTVGNAVKYIHNKAEPKWELLYSNSREGNSPFAPSSSDGGFVQMQGQEVYEFAVRAIPREITTALAAVGMETSEVKYFLLHQANSRIINAARAKLKQPGEKFPVNIDRYANTTAATIPILLDEMLEEGKISKGDTLVLVGFGAGMTIGTCVMEWE